MMNRLFLSYIASVLLVVYIQAESECLVGRVCPTITDKVTCLSSRDNRAGHLNVPCTWCDGPSCSGNNGNKCEPVEWLFESGNQVEPEEYTIASIGLTPRTCPTIQDASVCLSSKDDRDEYLDQPCVWCSAGECTNNGNRCEPAGWLFERSDQLNPQAFKVAVACTPLTGGCLVPQVCPLINELSTCLASKDNRDAHFGVPCVWCHGGACTAGTNNRCEPVEWLFERDNQLFPGEYEIASSGLTPQPCNSITQREICLSSRDNRAYAGILDSPCVWCKAGPCTGNNGNQCEPAGWLFEIDNQLNSDDYEVAVAGYSGIINPNGVICSDVNECERNPCGTNGVCINKEGSYQCQCNNGYEFDGDTCVDINECKGDNACGDYPTRCINTLGGYYCVENCIVYCEGDDCQQ